MPPPTKLVEAQTTRLDKACGVDAQSKSVFEDELEAHILQTESSLLDQTGKTIHTSSRPLV